MSDTQQNPVSQQPGLGHILRKARQAKNITWESIERHTNIRAVHLKNLEQEQFHLLPPPVYTKGFLRTYASYLGIDPDTAVDLYIKSSGIIEKKDQKIFLTPKVLPSLFDAWRQVIVWGGIVVLIMIVAVIVVVIFRGSGEKKRMEEVFFTMTGMKQDTKVDLLKDHRDVQEDSQTTRMTLQQIIGEKPQ